MIDARSLRPGHTTRLPEAVRRLSGLVLPVVLASFLTSPAIAASLEQELAGFIDNHPLIKAGRTTVQSAGENINIGNAGYFPTVALNATGGRQVIDNPTTRAAGKDSSLVANTTTLTVTQNLFNGFLTHSTVRTARLNKALAEVTLEGTLQNTLFEGIGAYIDVLRQLRLVQLSANNQATIQQQLHLEDERVQRGSGIAVDVLQAKSRLQLAKERRVTFEGALEDAVSRFTQVFDHSPDIESMTDPVPPVELIPSELDKAIETALQENPAIINSAVTVETARQSRATVRSEYAPIVDVVGSVNYENDNAGTVGTRRDYSVLLQANWNLFSGFSTRAGMSQASFNYATSRNNHDQTVRKVIEQMQLSWQALLTARARLELLENAVNIASEVFTSRQKLRQAGKDTVINVLDAENEVNNAQINYTAASYDERVAIYQVMLAMGRLNPVHLNLAAN